MREPSRREFLAQTGLGVASAAGALTLRADACPTPPSPDASEAEQVLIEMGPPPDPIPVPDGPFERTRATVYGPFYQAGAPFRAKVCPPHEPGTTLVVSGRVWGHDTKKPIRGALLEIWHCDLRGRYSGDDGKYRNRVRLITNESGYYEFETIHPVGYQPNPSFWRSAHIHFVAQAPGYKRLVSEIFFEGDPKHDIDQLFHPALEAPVKAVEAEGKRYETAAFDIVLAKA